MKLKELIEIKLYNSKDLGDFKHDSEDYSKIFKFNYEKMANQISKKINKNISKNQILKYISFNKKTINKKSKKEIKQNMIDYFK